MRQFIGIDLGTTFTVMASACTCGTFSTNRLPRRWRTGDGCPWTAPVLVFGLGGGVFEASLLQVGGDCVEVRATTGDRRLGGWDWDNLLMRLIQDRLTPPAG